MNFVKDKIIGKNQITKKQGAVQRIRIIPEGIKIDDLKPDSRMVFEGLRNKSWKETTTEINGKIKTRNTWEVWRKDDDIEFEYRRLIDSVDILCDKWDFI